MYFKVFNYIYFYNHVKKPTPVLSSFLLIFLVIKIHKHLVSIVSGDLMSYKGHNKKTDNLSENNIKLLALLSLLTRPAKDSGDKEIWLKDVALFSLVYRGIISNIFDYDYSSRLVIWKGFYRFMNISQECLSDLDFLIKKGLVEKLRIATKTHWFIIAYRITEKGIKLLENYPTVVQEMQEFLKCKKHGEIMKLELENNAPYLRCSRGCKEEITVLETEDVSYNSEPFSTW